MTTMGNRLYQPENKKTTPERITLNKAESFAVLVVNTLTAAAIPIIYTTRKVVLGMEIKGFKSHVRR